VRRPQTSQDERPIAVLFAVRPEHARSGDLAAIAAYLGDSDAFDQSVTDFSQRYADKNEQDYQQFVTAVRSGRLEAAEGF
jgi:hypothetical protein